TARISPGSFWSKTDASATTAIGLNPNGARHDPGHGQEDRTQRNRLGRVLRLLQIPDDRDRQHQADEPQFSVLEEFFQAWFQDGLVLMSPSSSHGPRDDNSEDHI